MFTLPGSFLIRFRTFAEEDYIFRFVMCLMGDLIKCDPKINFGGSSESSMDSGFFPKVLKKCYCLHFDGNLFQDSAWISGFLIFWLDCWMKIRRDQTRPKKQLIIRSVVLARCQCFGGLV